MSPVPSLPTGGHGPAPSSSIFCKILQLAGIPAIQFPFSRSAGSGERNDAVSAPSRLLSKASLWIEQRRKWRVRYPSPVDQLFNQLELWKFCAISATMLTGVASFYHYELLSKECMRVSLFLLFLAMFFLTVAHCLKEEIPEIAAPAMLAGVSLIIGLFNAVVFVALDLSAHPFGALFYAVVCLGYVVLLFFNIYKIVKEDVRAHRQRGRWIWYF